MATYVGGNVFSTTKKIGITVGSTHEGEQIATLKGSEIALRGNIALAGLGITLPEPTTILTDSLSNRTVAENVGSANHCRHFLTRYDILKERIAAGEVRVVYVPDPENPSDYLSKFVDATKMARSVDYAAGQLRGKA